MAASNPEQNANPLHERRMVTSNPEQNTKQLHDWIMVISNPEQNTEQLHDRIMVTSHLEQKTKRLAPALTENKQNLRQCPLLVPSVRCPQMVSEDARVRVLVSV